MLPAHHKGVSPVLASGAGSHNLSRCALTRSHLAAFPLSAEHKQCWLRLTLPKDRVETTHTHTSTNLQYLQKHQYTFGNHFEMKIGSRHRSCCVPAFEFCFSCTQFSFAPILLPPSPEQCGCGWRGLTELWQMGKHFPAAALRSFFLPSELCRSVAKQREVARRAGS